MFISDVCIWGYVNARHGHGSKPRGRREAPGPGLVGRSCLIPGETRMSLQRRQRVCEGGSNTPGVCRLTGHEGAGDPGPERPCVTRLAKYQPD